MVFDGPREQIQVPINIFRTVCHSISRELMINLLSLLR